MPKLHALVVAGSMNEERRFGLISGRRVADALAGLGWEIAFADAAQPLELISTMANGSFDLIVPIGFGPRGPEDGTIYTLSQMIGLPCAGPGPLCGSVCTDKFFFEAVIRGIFSKPLSATDGWTVRHPHSVLISRSDTLGDVEDAIRALRVPLIAKPAFGGSSVGIEIFDNKEDAIRHALGARMSAGRILVQEFIQAIEVSATVIDALDGLHICPLVELDRRDSLIMGVEEKFGDTSASRHIIPARLAPNTRQAIDLVTRTLHSKLGCRGVARVDFLVDENLQQLTVLEVNPLAGLLQSSIAVDAARADGLDFVTLAESYAMTAFLDRCEPTMLVALPQEWMDH